MKKTRDLWFLAVLILLVAGAWAAAAAAETTLTDRVPSAAEMAQIRQEVEILRGKKFKRDVPARTISEAELRAIVDHEVAKDYPGSKLADLEELMAWLDILPPNTDLKRVCEDFLVGQVAGLYDTETKTMCIPSFSNTKPPAAKTTKGVPRKKVEEISGADVAVVFAHEYTHALEDQYWPLDEPKDKDAEISTDRDDARSFLFEGSATRLMIEAMPAEMERNRPGTYVMAWNILHSRPVEAVLDFFLSRVWKGPDAEVAGVPDALARGEAMPYSFGYSFCRRIQRDWGLDGLDYIYDHQPVSTEQVIHPEKCWEWRDFPVQVDLPQSLPGGWKRRIDDTIGEAGIAVLIGCQLKDLTWGQRIGSGWDGDRVALYDGPDGHRLLVWASAWDSPAAAERFSHACAAAQTASHRASVTLSKVGRLAWTTPDRRAGLARWKGKHALIFQTDVPDGLGQNDTWATAVTFTEPPEDAARTAVNHALLRFNPLVSWRKDGEYAVTKSLAGLLWRHDHNRVGTADRALLGLVGERRRTTSLNKWELGWGLAARHESEARRQFDKTTLLPWGVLYSHFSAALPQPPTNSLCRTKVLWGLLASRRSLSEGGHTVTVLPWGLLLRDTEAPDRRAFHVIGTGISRAKSRSTGEISRFRVLGIPVWTKGSAL